MYLSLFVSIVHTGFSEKMSLMYEMQLLFSTVVLVVCWILSVTHVLYSSLLQDRHLSLTGAAEWDPESQRSVCVGRGQRDRKDFLSWYFSGYKTFLVFVEVHLYSWFAAGANTAPKSDFTVKRLPQNSSTSYARWLSGDADNFKMLQFHLLDRSALLVFDLLLKTLVLESFGWRLSALLSSVCCFGPQLWVRPASRWTNTVGRSSSGL